MKIVINLYSSRLQELMLQKSIIGLTMKRNTNPNDKGINKMKDNVYFKLENYYDLFAMTPINRRGTMIKSSKRRLTECDNITLLQIKDEQLDSSVSNSEVNSCSEVTGSDVKMEKRTTFKLPFKKNSTSTVNNITFGQKKALTVKSNKNRRDISIESNESDNFNKLENPLIQSVTLKNIIYSHDITYQNWADNQMNYQPVHNALKSYMKLSNDVSIQHSTFRERFVEECNRNFVFAHTNEGSVEITPIQLLHLPESNSSIFVRISYGNDVSIYLEF